MAEFITPMLLKNCPLPFDDGDFLFEFKFDGVRAVLDCLSEPLIYNRQLKIKTHLYPEITAAAKTLEKGIALDGEIIAVDEKGKQSFYSVLERDLAKKYSPSNVSVFYMAFDILYFKNESVINRPLSERKKLLKIALENCLSGGAIRPVDSFYEEGKMLYSAAENAGMEGIIAKRISSVYTPGARGEDWLKIKCSRYIDAFVLGYTPTASRISLLLGVKTANGYKHIGNVSNGLKNREWKELEKMLECCAGEESRFSDFVPNPSEKIIFTEPIVKLSVKYLEQDEGGKLRHPVIERIY